MGLFDHFPYTNIHEMNLDWIMQMMKALEAAWGEFVAGNSLTFADPLLHDLTSTYAKNTIVLDKNGNAYVSLKAVPVGVNLSNTEYWLMVFDYEAFLEKVNKNFTDRYYRNEPRAKAAMSVGDWLTFDDVLCKVTAAIAEDDLLEVGVNIEHFTLEDFIKAFMQSATQTIQQYKDDIDASELLYRQQLAGDIEQTTASLQAQLNAIIAGSTVDSEVIDARVGADGVTYPTLGDAIRTQFSDVWDELENNVVEILQHNSTAVSGSNNGLDYIYSGNTCAVSGTSSALSASNIISSIYSLPYGWKAGETYYVKVNTTDPYVRLGFFFYDSNAQQIGSGMYASADRLITVPATAAGMLARINVASGLTVNATITYNVYTSRTANELSALCEKAIKGEVVTLVSLGISDLNSVPDNSVYLVDSDTPYTHKPDDMGAGFIMTILVKNFKLQLAWALSGGKMWKRRYTVSTASWESWYSISGTGNTYNNYYSFPEYNNTYNISSSPSITTDTNAFLAPSGDNSDRTADIVQMLSSYGICRLGKGDYYVNNLEMPNGSMIAGSGYSSRIILAGSSDGYAIKMNNNTIVKDVAINGNVNGITPDATLGGRHGILWQGDYTDDPTPANQPQRSIINNVYISSFSGGGITCYDTGYGTYNNLEVSNVYCNNCGAGINIAYWSEFHKFTNIRAQSSYYGCINNGGNNSFVNCDFSGNIVGFLMDNSNNQSPNNSHGHCVGCIFNHTNQNTGIGIKILNCDNGFIFDSCQIFFSQIHIEDSEGVVICNSNFGTTNSNITISGGGAIIFTNNMHGSQPTISVSSNTNVHFDNCYVRSTGAAVTP